MDTGKYSGFEVAIDENGITTVMFDRPEKLNTLTRGLKRDFIEMLQQPQMERRVRVLIFTGNGKAFAAGDDIGGTGYGAEQLVPSKVPPLQYGEESPQLRTYDF